jgi:hypothetical protein
VFLVILWKDAILASLFGWKDGVHVGVGTLVMLIELRPPQRVHVRLPQLPAPRRRQREQLLDGALGNAPPRLWKLVTVLNERHHAEFAWDEPLLRGADRRLHPRGRDAAASPT